jgi:hypothetical protein
MSSNTKCVATNLQGNSCRFSPLADSNYCWTHRNLRVRTRLFQFLNVAPVPAPATDPKDLQIEILQAEIKSLKERNSTDDISITMRLTITRR